MSSARATGVLMLLCAALGLATGVPVLFVDIAPSAGLNVPNTFGGKDRKDYILESTGNGVAVLDYDRDGAEDIFIANGTTLHDAETGARSPGSSSAALP